MKELQKKKKLVFKRSDFQLKKLKNKWRKPKGKQNKLRLSKAGQQKRPKIGYQNPKQIKNLFQSKFIFIKVNNFKDLEKANDNILLSKNLGINKKLKIIEKALEMKLNILNLKDPQEFIRRTKEKIEQKKKSKRKKEVKIKEEKKIEKPEENKEGKEKREEELKRKILEGKKQR